MGTVYPIYQQYTRVVEFPTEIVNTECDRSCRVIADRTRSGIFPKKILSGDFNGDGITDVIAIDTDLSTTNSCRPLPVTNPPSCGYLTGNTLTSKKVYFIDLRQDNTNNFLVYTGDLAVGLNNSTRIEVGDFNGDGRSDFYVFEPGFVKVYSLNENNNLIILYQNTVSDTNISFSTTNGTSPGSFTKPFLMGDYNGDGKTDFMIPQGGDSPIWHKYMSTGSTVLKETKTFSTMPFKTANLYGVADCNNDGKADLLITRTYTVSSVGQMEIEYVINKNGEFVTGMGVSFKSNTGNNGFSVGSANILLYADQNSKTYGTAYSPSMEIAYFNSNKIHYFNSQKNYKKDNLLTNVTVGNGVQESLTYIPLDSKYTGDSPYNYIYNSSPLTENYPNIDIQIDPNLFVVSKLEKQSTSQYKRKLFTYYNAVANVEGLGFLGFRAVNQTDWHDDNTTLFSNVYKNDITLRGVLKETFKAPYMYYPTDGLTAPADFVSKSLLTYNTAANALQPNKVFKLTILNAKEFNGIENTNTEMTNILYDGYNNIKSSNLYTKEGTSLIKTVTAADTYENLTTSPYIIGRPLKKVESITMGGNSSSNEESYTYTNNLLTKIEKKGNNTGTIAEDLQYDNFGNVITQTVTAPDPAAPRINNFQYDTSGRFLIKYTDVERLETKYEYDSSSGALKKITDPNSLSESYTYDSWLNKLTAKDDNLNKIISYSYTKNINNVVLTSTGDSSDPTFTEEIYDDLGRKIKSGVMDVNGNISYVDYLYDIKDQNYKISEPYFGTSPAMWNEIKFDIYGRPTQNILFNSRSSSLSYTGLVKTFSDGLRTKTFTKNAIGNIVSMQENTGGIINYQYFPNGNLKQSSYNGVDVKMEQDGWGRNKKLTDGTDGDYLYNRNDLGELKSQTSTNGAVTTITRDNYGRVTNKTILGPFTDTQTTYEYNNLKLPILITFVDNLQAAGANTTITSITYDPVLKKPLTIIEDIAGYAKFTKTFTYDIAGRIFTERKKAEIGSKSSIATIKYIYQNGFLYQIQDELTSKILWQVNSLNAKGQIIENIIGNGIKMTNTFDQNGYLSKIQHDKTTAPTANIITLTTEFNKNNDNLDKRINSAFNNWTETFKYDDLDRLTEFTNGIGVQETQNYESSGKIKNNILGTYNYAVSTKPNQNTSITLTPEAAGYYSNREGIFNDSMENRMGWGTERYPSTLFYSYDNVTTAHTGKNSLKLANTNTAEQYVYSDKWVDVSNIAATNYTYSAWIYSSSPQAEIVLVMKDSQGVLSYNSVVSNVSGSWTQVTKTFSVPANVKSLRLRLDNNGLGNIWFDDVQIRKTSIPSVIERKLSIDYNAFKCPTKIEETGVEKINFTYNDNNQRSIMFYGGFEDKLLRQYRKYYSADGTMEIKQDRNTGNLEFVTYIGGDGYSAPIVAKSNGIAATPEYLYLHRDYQGSIMAITNSNGSILEKRLYDAWGNISKVMDGANNTLPGLVILDRGYTGHEHLQSVGLINMNARLYDPKLHRFLSVDNYIQDPLNTQNYNQYGYVYNNPNKYVDFSGNVAQKNGPGDPKKPLLPTDITELEEVIVSRKSPAGYGYGPSNGPSLVMSPFSGITGNIEGLGRFINTDYVSYTSTHQTGKKAEWNSGVGDKIKIKTYVSLRTGNQGIFEVNDSFFNGKDEGRNYQINLGEHSLNFRPKDTRLRYMAPSYDNTAQGFSIGEDGLGWHYNIRNGNGRSAGTDVSFKPGGYTLLLITGTIMAILQPEAIPVLEKVAEEIIIPGVLAY